MVMYRTPKTFFFDGSNGGIAATGNLVKEGAGKLEISGAHTFDGNAAVEGTLLLRDGASLAIAGAFTVARAPVTTQYGTVNEFPNNPGCGAIAATGAGNRIKADSIALPSDVVFAFDLTGTVPGAAPLLTLDSAQFTGQAVGAGHLEVSGFSDSASGDYALARVTNGTVATTGTLLAPYVYRGGGAVGSTQSGVLITLPGDTYSAPPRSNTDGSETNTYLFLKRSADAQTLLLSVNHAAAGVHSTDLTWTGATDTVWRDAEYRAPQQTDRHPVLVLDSPSPPLPNWAGTVSGDNGPAAVVTFLNGDDVTFADTAAPAAGCRRLENLLAFAHINRKLPPHLWTNIPGTLHPFTTPCFPCSCGSHRSPTTR
jgi:autotransporter-associated beta strand protein